jgi:hypothetical protein
LGQVRGQVWDQARDQARDQVWDQVLGQVRDQVWDQVGNQIYGAHEAAQLAFYDFFQHECGIKECSKLKGLMDMARASGWWAPYRNAAIFQDRPCELHFDNSERLHNAAGPAILYRDGFAVYAWHGTRIPATWINTPGFLTPSIALAIDNIEQRRAACEILGWARILDELNCTVLDKNDNPEIGTLLEVDLPDAGKERFLVVRCGTARTFAIPMPQHIFTAQEGNAWSYGIEEDVDHFCPEVRT